MLWLTEETGQDVITSDGTVLGPVRDLSAHLGGETGAPVVSRLVIGGRGTQPRLVAWADIESFEHTRVILRAITTVAPNSWQSRPDSAGSFIASDYAASRTDYPNMQWRGPTCISPPSGDTMSSWPRREARCIVSTPRDSPHS